eukprot:Awhi_evm1s15742
MIVTGFAFLGYMIPNMEAYQVVTPIFGFFLIASAVFMCIGTFESAADSAGVIHKDYNGQDTLSVFNGLGVFAFVFGGHSTFPGQIWEMKKPQQWNTMFNCLWPVVGAFLLITGVIGFWGYGFSTDAIIFYSMRPNNTITTIATIFGLIYSLSTILIWINMLFQTYERRMKIPTHTFFQGSVFFIAVLLPHDFGYIQAIVGSFSIALGTFLVPPLLYLKLVNYKDMGFWYFLLMIALAIFGAVLVFVGTTVAFINIVDSFDSFGVFGEF